jgi:Flp pilus assembly protein TadG
MIARLQRRKRAQRGTAAIEYALILPILLMFVLGLMDTGRLLWSYVTLNRAVAAAARCGAVSTSTCGTAAQIRSYAVSQAFGMTLDTTAFTVATVACGMQVSGTYDFEFIVPGFNYVVPLGIVTLSVKACYPN